jgi:hypothetical protein
MGNDMLGDASAQHPIEGAETARADDDGVEAALGGDPLDRAGRVAQRFEQVHLESVLRERPLRVVELSGVRLAAVPRLRRLPVGPDRDHGNDAQRCAEREGQLSRRLKGPARRLTPVVREKDSLHCLTPARESA